MRKLRSFTRARVCIKPATLNSNRTKNKKEGQVRLAIVRSFCYVRPLGPRSLLAVCLVAHVSPILCERSLTRFTRCKGFVLFCCFWLCCVLLVCCFCLVWSGSPVQPVCTPERMRTLFPVAESFAHYGQKKATLTNLNSNLVNSQCWKLPQLLLFQSWWFLSFSTGEFIFVLTTSGNQLFKLFGKGTT